MLRVMQSDPHQEKLNRLTLAVVELMAQEMDEQFQYLLRRAGPERYELCKAVEAANTIVVVCRDLVQAIRRYECYDLWRREYEAEQTTSSDEENPF